jgi:ubiquinone/menaquinone biosynthesis C-methylase UbiE
MTERPAAADTGAERQPMPGGPRRRIPGQNGRMAEPRPVGVSIEDYDAAHTALHDSPLMRRLWSEAMGEQYPAEVDPFSSCSWWLLGQLVAGLRPRPGGRLVDLGCGRGGPGLWLARALSVDLIGVDFSPVAVRLAAARAAAFVPAGRARFHQATFERTDLPDACADAVVSVDALPFAEDRAAALREVRRILVPGGRLAFTARVQPGGRGDWPATAESAGLVVEDRLATVDNDEFWHRLHASWLAHEAQLRAELGTRAADNLIAEAVWARQLSPDLPSLELLMLRRPATGGSGG